MELYVMKKLRVSRVVGIFAFASSVFVRQENRKSRAAVKFFSALFVLLGLSVSAATAQTYNQIRFVIGTGGADLRNNCVATATLKAPNGSVLQAITLYNGSGSGWPNNSTNTVTATLSPARKASDIGTIVITQIEHNGFGQTDNNWNINSVVVSLSNNGAGSQEIVNVSGNPVQRLTGSAPSFTLTPPPPSPPGAFNTIQFVIATGGADLRDNSVATATLEAANGSVLQTFTLYNGTGSGWPNNSTNTVKFTLNPPRKPADISHIVITQIEHNGTLQTDNN
jgi:phosphoribosylformimino-5-aminoimidazole carboxamide ribonucleotide (ProFAR) isomerase